MIPRPGHSHEARTPEIVESLLRDGYDVRLRLTGVSMKPLVPPGSVVHFAPAVRRTPTVGDIVLTRRGDGMLVAHRLTALDSEQVWTRGDSVGRPDAPVERECLLGCAVRLESPFGLPLRNPAARLLGRLLSRAYPFTASTYRAMLRYARREVEAS